MTGLEAIGARASCRSLRSLGFEVSHGAFRFSLFWIRAQCERFTEGYNMKRVLGYSMQVFYVILLGPVQQK